MYNPDFIKIRALPVVYIIISKMYIVNVKKPFASAAARLGNSFIITVAV
jgi:hypothetical protein